MSRDGLTAMYTHHIVTHLVSHSTNTKKTSIKLITN